MISDDKLIADFLDMEWDSFDRKHVDFSGDWNWLMLAVEKIESINNSTVQINGSLCHISYHDTNGFWNHKISDGHPKIISTYKAVVEFIKWYNQQQS